MGRSYRRKNEKKDPKVIENAMEAIRSGQQVRSVARNFNVPRSTLRSRMKRPAVLKRANKVLYC